MTHLFELLNLGTTEGIRKVTETLVRAFRKDEIAKLKKGGSELDYIETTTCIDRLNEAFTPLGWGYDCKHLEWQPAAEGLTSRQIGIYGVLTIHTPWGDITKGQWGARTVMSQADGTKMDFGDDLKSASSDALKKCASLLGVFNYGYRKGKPQPDSDVVEIAKQLIEESKKRHMTTQQFLDFCGGVTRKTILGAGDLSFTQAQACLSILKLLTPEGNPFEAAAKE